MSVSSLGGDSMSLSKFSGDEKTIVTVKSSLSIHNQTSTRVVPVYKKEYKSHIEINTNEGGGEGGGEEGSTKEAGESTMNKSPVPSLFNIHQAEKDNVVVTSLIATGGGDGYVRIWRMTAKYTINKAIDTKTKSKSGIRGGASTADTNTENDEVKDKVRPFTFLKKHGVLFEPLSKLSINLNASVKASMPLPSFYQPRRQALADVGKRPCGVKAIALLSPNPRSKSGNGGSHMSDSVGGRSHDASVTSSFSSSASSFSQFSSHKLNEQQDEEDKFHAGREEDYVPDINLLVSTTGGNCLSFLPRDSEYNQARCDEEDEDDDEETEEALWKLQAITNAGHFKGPSIDIAHHPFIPGLYFTIATDRQLCAWYSSSQESEPCLTENRWEHQLIGCLTLRRHPTALAVSTHITNVEDDHQQTKDSALLKCIHLSVGFADGSLMEYVLTFKLLDIFNEDYFNDHQANSMSGSSDSTGRGESVDDIIDTFPMYKYEAYYFEEVSYYPGFRVGEGLAGDEQDEELGQYGLNNMAKLDQGAQPYHKVTCLTYGVLGHFIVAGRSNGRIQIRVSSSYHFHKIKVYGNIKDTGSVATAREQDVGKVIQTVKMDVWNNKNRSKNVIKLNTSLLSNLGIDQEDESSVGWTIRKYLKTRQQLLLDIRVSASAITSCDFSNADILDFNHQIGISSSGSNVSATNNTTSTNATSFQFESKLKDMFERQENTVIGCVVRTSDSSKEVRFHRVTLRTCTASYFESSVNEENNGSGGDDSLASGKASFHSQKKDSAIDQRNITHLAVWRLGVSARSPEQCSDATFPSWTSDMGFQVMGIWNASAKSKGAPIADVSALHYVQREYDKNEDRTKRGISLHHKLNLGSGNVPNTRVQDGYSDEIEGEEEREKDRQGLVLVGDAKGGMRILRSPVLAQSSRCVSVPNAHVSRFVGIRSCELPHVDNNSSYHQPSVLPTHTFANSMFKEDSVHKHKTFIVGSLGAGDNVFALWKITLDITQSSKQQVDRKDAMLIHDEKLWLHKGAEYGPLRCHCSPLPGTQPELTLADDTYQHEQHLLWLKQQKDMEKNATTNVNANEDPGLTNSGPRMLVCYICGQAAMLSAYVLHIIKCGKKFKKIQDEKELERNLPTIRAAPMGPPTPYNSNVFQSMRTLVEWQRKLPIPSPPKGIHERFTRCLSNVADVKDDEKQEGDGDEQGNGGEDGSIVMTDPNGITHLDDTKALKKLKKVELEEANRDARKAFWIGNSLVCPHCLGRVHWEKCEMHAKFCNSKTAKLRRREDVLVETDHYPHAMTTSRPPIQVKPGTATAREALLFKGSQEVKTSLTGSSDKSCIRKSYSDKGVMAIHAAEVAVEKTAMLWSTANGYGRANEFQARIGDTTIAVGDILNTSNVFSLSQRNTRDGPLFSSASSAASFHGNKSEVISSNPNTAKIRSSLDRTNKSEINVQDITTEGVDIDFDSL